MQELVSIIVPVYNMGDKLEKSIQALRAQTYENIEIILVNDGSKDNSGEVCEKLAKQDSRITAIHTENKGSGPARNTGIAASKGDYLYFPDADDFLEPNAIEIMVAATGNGKYDLVVFGYKNCNSNDEVISERTYEEAEFTGDEIRSDYTEFFGMSRRFSIQGAPWNKFFSGKVVRENKIQYPALRRQQDEGFIARYMSHCGNAHFIPNVLYTYYLNTMGLTWQKFPQDYMECVMGIHAIFMETIASWNDNTKVKNMLLERHISDVISALELAFSPKLGLNMVSRRTWLNRQIKITKLDKYPFSLVNNAYPKLALLFSKLKCYDLLALLIYVGILKHEK